MGDFLPIDIKNAFLSLDIPFIVAEARIVKTESNTFSADDLANVGIDERTPIADTTANSTLTMFALIINEKGFRRLKKNRRPVSISCPRWLP